MLIPLIGGWFTRTMADLFIQLLDKMAYNLLSVSYNVFVAIARIDIFGGSDGGKILYDNITRRIYTILSIAMIFVFAYQLIMLIIDPEGKEKNASSKLVKDTVLSIVLIILLPTIFKYMSTFQAHVLGEGTIPAIILGTRSGNDEDPGKSIALMVYMAFYHPKGTMWNTYFKSDGTLDRANALSNCKNDTKEAGEEFADTCKKYVDVLIQWEDSTKKTSGIGYITSEGDLRRAVDEDEGGSMEYMWILTTAAGVLVAWLFFSYAIDIGTRAIKLGVLELISPIPVIFRAFSQSRKIFDTWFLEIRKTYLEIFIRLIIIFFGIEIVKMVPDFIEIIFKRPNDGTINDSVITKCVATVILILGVLKFCQIAPDLFKEIFSAGNNLLKDVNLKPGMKSRIEDNKVAMKGMSTVTGIAAGGAHRFMNGYKEGHDNLDGLGDSWAGKAVKSFGGLLNGVLSLPRGLIAGGVGGWNNDSSRLNREMFENAATEGARTAQNSHENRRFLRRTHDNAAQFLHESTHIGDADAKTLAEAIVDNLIKGTFKAFLETIKEYGGENGKLRSMLLDPGSSKQQQDLLKNLTTILSNFFSIGDNAANEELLKQMKEEKRKLQVERAKLGSNVDPNDETLQKLDKSINNLTAEIENQQQKINETNAKTATANPEVMRNAANALLQGFEKGGAKMQKALDEALKNSGVDLGDLSGKEFLRQLSSGKRELSVNEIKVLKEMEKTIKGFNRVSTAGSTINDTATTKKNDSSK